MLDIQSLPSLEKFDSQLLDLFKPSAAEQAVAGALDDVAAGGDPDLVLQRLMSMKHLNSYRGSINPFTHGNPLAASNTATAAADAQAAAQGMAPTALDAAAAAMLAQTNAFLAGDMDELGGSETPAAAARESRRRNRGGRLGEFIKAEEEAGEGTSSAGAGRGGRRRDRECDEEPADSYDSTQSPSKRGRTNTANTGYDSDGGRSLAVTVDMDEATKTRIRREKNRVAARKCRAKKMQFMQDLQRTLRELMRKNEEYRLQVITWHKMFSREVRLREAMKRIISVMWQAGTSPASTGYTANDIIIGLESGTLDVNSLLRSLVMAGTSSGGSGSPSGASQLSSLAGGSYSSLSLQVGHGAAGGASGGNNFSERDLLAMQLANATDVAGFAAGSGVNTGLTSGGLTGLSGSEGVLMGELGAAGGSSGGGEGGWLWSDSVGLVGGAGASGVNCITTGAALDA